MTLQRRKFWRQACSQSHTKRLRLLITAIEKIQFSEIFDRNILFPYLEANMNGLAEAADEIMFQAIVFERINFINLLISSGRFVLRDFLTPAKLQKLYNESVRLKSTIRTFTNTTCLLTIEVSTNIKIASAFP